MLHGERPLTARSAASTTQEYLTFALGNDAYAIALSDVRELVAGHDVRPIAGTSPLIRGCIELRGKHVVVLDLRIDLFAPRVPDTRGSTLLVVRHEADGAWITAGILVDEVFGVVRLVDSEIDTSALDRERRSPILVGCASFDGRKLAVLELEELWSPPGGDEIVSLAQQLSQLGPTTRSRGSAVAERMDGTTWSDS